MSARGVYRSIHAVASEFADDGIAKSHTNLVDGYDYRSIDDLLERLAPLLAKHKLCILPRVVKHRCEDRIDQDGTSLLHVRLCAKFQLVSVEDGSQHVVEGFGEALDASDKATAKAMSSAYKSLMLQTFCVPAKQDDIDASSPRLSLRTHLREPTEGWACWCETITCAIEACDTSDALAALQEESKPLLIALSRERPDLYAVLGKRVIGRQESLSAARPRSRRQVSRKVASNAAARPSVGEDA